MPAPRTPMDMKWSAPWLRSILVVSLAFLSLSLAAARPAQTPAKVPFPHRSHVPAVWYERGASSRAGPGGSVHEFDTMEVERDCRGCHVFGEKDAEGQATKPARSPMDVCANCHYGDVLATEIQPGFEKGLREGRGSLSAYDHRDHLNLACRECHAPPTDLEVQDFSAATGVPACVTCHTQGGENRKYEAVAGRTVDVGRLQTGFVAWLNADPSMAREGRGPYPHDAHMSPAKLADKTACVECHADIDDADATDLHTKEYTAEECATCHVQADGKPVRIDRAIERRPSIAALTFAHDDHLGSGEDLDVVKAGSRAEIESRGCLACHAHSGTAVRAPDGSALPPTFIVREDRDDYDGCVSCHDVPAFRAQNHGKWETCTGCHSFGEGDLADVRPQAAVDRARPGQVTFLMASQAHPGIAGKPAQDCSSCHRASLPALPSRITGKRFEHASHLGRDPKAADCQLCHAGVAASAGSTAIGAPWDDARAASISADRRLTFETSACTTCHPGIQVDPASLAKPERRDVVAFDHAAHMSKARDPRTGQMVTCTSCHEFDASARGTDIGVRKDALSCVQCHLHDDVHAPWTGGIAKSGVDSCENCHQSGIPALDTPPDVDRVRVALKGPQHHPANSRCSDCHSMEAPGVLEPVTAVLATFPRQATWKPENAYFARSPHKLSEKEKQASRGPADGCQNCHWAVSKNQLTEGRVDGNTRKRNGSRMLVFPGGEDHFK